MENKICRQCGISFIVSDDDLKFLEKISPEFTPPSLEASARQGKKYLIPSPTLCPTCRLQRRLAHRNERKLYKRKCDATGKDIVSLYSPNKPYKVFDQEYWWSDKWEAMDFGQDYDFSRPFFEQFKELYDRVPKLNIINSGSENSEYTNLAAYNKNCYMIVESSNNENCYYDYWIQLSKNLVDSCYAHQSEIGYWNSDIREGYNLQFCRKAINCRDSFFLEDSVGCKNCFAGTNLHNKEYYLFNQPANKEQFEETLQIWQQGNQEERRALYEKINKFFSEQPLKAGRIVNSENCVGDYISDSKDCYMCFDASESESCRYCSDVMRNVKEAMDTSTAGLDCELMYECLNTAINVYKMAFTNVCWTNLKNVLYSMYCYKSEDIFGCVGLRDHKQYCILNKQYTKEEYERLIPNIIGHMISTGEWGEFFPMNVSAYGYNETVAQDHFVLTKDEAEKLGANWEDGDFTPKYDGEVYKPKPIDLFQLKNNPQAQTEIDLCLKGIIKCEKSGRPFKILPQELAFYIENNIELPKIHPDERHLERINNRHHYKLEKINCDNCGQEISTSLPKNIGRKIYCEECWQKSVL